MSGKIILASSSPYRKALLNRLDLSFTVIGTDIDESPEPGEAPQQLVLRLAEAKALSAARLEPEALIIGSDQVAVLNGSPLGKPGSYENAVRQLRSMSGHCVHFHTALCLLNAATGTRQCRCVPYDVTFRELSDAEIERYLMAEQPYRCAGSFKSEQLGIALVERMDGEDPTALVGLPLIALRSMLAQEGLVLP
ncbi:MAG: Maf family protein [Gammaproteobacteria bacterium]